MENIRVIKQVFKKVVETDDKASLFITFEGGYCTIDSNIDRKTIRITIEEVQVFPEVRVGQIWQDKTHDCVVLDVNEYRVRLTYARNQLCPVFTCDLATFVEDYTLIQDVVEVTR